jgi:selenide,water dikinase
MFPAATYPDVLVGLSGGDDAAVYRISDELSLILTVDFITPVVDDPEKYGMIAASNALSDVYAMGGDVKLCLNICGIPPQLPESTVTSILRGGALKVLEAGGVLVGGHTVEDQEPKYGLVVLGTAHPQRILSKTGAECGDRIILTKPLGIGIVTTAFKGDAAKMSDMEEATDWMLGLNRKSSEIIQGFELTTCTDVTGFSLLGHALDVAVKSEVGIRFHLERIPFISGAEHYARDWLFPAGTCNNQRAYEQLISFHPDIPEETRQLLFTPETSGGLLVSVPEQHFDMLSSRFREMEQPFWEIGEVIRGRGIEVTVS